MNQPVDSIPSEHVSESASHIARETLMRQWLADNFTSGPNPLKDKKKAEGGKDGSSLPSETLTLQNVQSVVLLVCLDSLHSIQKIVGIKSEQIGQSAEEQKNYNEDIKAIKWATVDPAEAAKWNKKDGNNPYVTKIEDENKHAQELSSVYQSLVMSNRQGAQATITEANESVKSSEQIVSETSGLIKTQNQCFQEIEKIGQPRG